MRSIIGTTRRPDIIFWNSGLVEISARITKTLGLKSGDVIDVLEGTNEYLLYVKYRQPIGKHEGTVRSSRGKGNFLRAWSIKLCREMFRICNATGEKRIKLLTGGLVTLPSGEKAINIITQNIYGTTRD